MASLGDLFVTVGAKIDGFTSAMADVSSTLDSIKGSVEGLQTVSEALVGIGEALAVTEKLKEFGEEALNAAGTVQSVTAALTQLTGSTDAAREAVESIKELAATEPFAFPEIAPTIQRMIALGVTVEQLPTVMQAVADSAAATGNSFSAVANSFDRVAVSGNANARQLVQLGISLEDLGRVMGVTADQVTQAFKALDESERIETLTQALEKFAGSAKAQADTISGEWQIFKNQFEEVMVAVGDALTPAVTDLLNFGKSTLSAIQTALDAFNSLPGPVKEVAGAIGILGAGIAPLTAAIGTLGLGLVGIQAVIGPLTELLEAFGVAGGEAAAGEEAAAVATEHLATAQQAVAASGAAAEIESTAAAAVEAEAGIGSVATALGSFAAVTAGPVIASIIAFKSNLDELKGKYDEFVAEINRSSIIDALKSGDTVKALQDIGYTIDQIKVALSTLGVSGKTTADALASSMDAPTKALEQLGISIEDVQAKLRGLQVDGIPVFQILAKSPDFDTFKKNIEALGGNIDQIVAKLNQLTPSSTNLAASYKALSDSLGIVYDNGQKAQTALDNLGDKQDKANQSVKDAKSVLDLAKASLDGTAESQQVYNLAVIAYQQALDAANPKTKDFADTVAGLTQAMTLAQEKFASAQSVFETIKQRFDDGRVSSTLLVDAYNKLQAAAKAVGDQYIDLDAEVLKINDTFSKQQATLQADLQIYDTFLQKLADGTATISQLVEAYNRVQAAAKAVGDSFVTAAGEIAKVTEEASSQITTLGADIEAFAQLKAAANDTITSQIAVSDAFKKVVSDASALGVQIKQVGDGYVIVANEMTPATQAVVQQIQQWMTQQGLLVQVMQNGIPVVIDSTNGIVQYGKSITQATGPISQLITTQDGATIKVTNFRSAVGQATQAIQDAAPHVIDLTGEFGNLTGAVNGATDAHTRLKGAASDTYLTIMNGSTDMSNAASTTVKLSDAVGVLQGKYESLTEAAYEAATAIDRMKEDANEAATSIDGIDGQKFNGTVPGTYYNPGNANGGLGIPLIPGGVVGLPSGAGVNLGGTAASIGSIGAEGPLRSYALSVDSLAKVVNAATDSVSSLSAAAGGPGLDALQALATQAHDAAIALGATTTTSIVSASSDVADVLSQLGITINTTGESASDLQAQIKKLTDAANDGTITTQQAADAIAALEQAALNAGSALSTVAGTANVTPGAGTPQIIDVTKAYAEYVAAIKSATDALTSQTRDAYSMGQAMQDAYNAAQQAASTFTQATGLSPGSNPFAGTASASGGFTSGPGGTVGSTPPTYDQQTGLWTVNQTINGETFTATGNSILAAQENLSALILQGGIKTGTQESGGLLGTLSPQTGAIIAPAPTIPLSTIPSLDAFAGRWTGGATVTVPITVNGSLVGSGGINELATQVQKAVVQGLQFAGQKIL